MSNEPSYPIAERPAEPPEAWEPGSEGGPTTGQQAVGEGDSLQSPALSVVHGDDVGSGARLESGDSEFVDDVEGGPRSDSGSATERDAESPATVPSRSRLRVLEREGEVAADFLERLLDIADLDGDLEVDIDGDRAAVAIVDSEDGRVPRRLIGPDGKVLEALQELTRLAVQAETGERSRLMLDIAGHRASRRSVLVDLARSTIADVKASGEKRALEDMTAFERKIVHDEVAAAGLQSESEGVEPHRHIVVFPA
jgi:spoIIIJ-associated protein